MILQYSKCVMKHFINPKNMGEIKNADGIGKVGNLRCGDIMWIYIKVKNDKIKDIKFKTFGCVAAIATSSMITQIIKGKSIKDAQKVKYQDIVKFLGGLPPIKIHCSHLAQEALKRAIKDYEKKDKENEK